MEDHVDDTSPYRIEQLVKDYAISPQEAERILEQFGSERSEIDLLLGHRGAAEADSPNLPDRADGDFLFEI